MPRKKKIKKSSSFHDRFPKEFGGFKKGDELVYKRMPDSTISIGIVSYFHVGGKRPSATLIDLVLGNFQSAFLEDMNLEITASKKNSILQKITIKNLKKNLKKDKKK